MTLAVDDPTATSSRIAARTFVIGARGGRLSLAQADFVSQALRTAAPTIRVELRVIETDGDRDRTAPLSEIGGQGVFTKAIENALCARTIDIAVHSLKDLPTQLADGLAIAAVPPRADARDALITRDGSTLRSLPRNARIGTSSSRRAHQLRLLRPDIVPVEIRGNVDTRIRKLRDGEYDGLLLALAGLQRLGASSVASQILTIEEMIPAVGQGALAVEVRADDEAALELASALDHRRTRLAVEAERAWLAELGAGCQWPVGAHASIEGDRLQMVGVMFRGGKPFRDSAVGLAADAQAIGRRLAQTLTSQAEIVEADPERRPA